MRISGCIVLVAVFVAALNSLPPSGQQQDLLPAAGQEIDVVRVETTLITLPVRVKDRTGKFIPTLQREQFHIYEDGVEQEIAYFEPPREANETRDFSSKPLTIALLLDVSDSTQFKLEQIQSTAISFVDLLSPGDRVLVISFDKRVHVLAQATDDRNAVRAAIRQARPGGGTSLYLALNSAMYILNRTTGRKAIILLTDGVDTASTGATSESTVRTANESDISIYPIQYHTYGDFADNPSKESYVAGDFGTTAHVTKSGEPASEAYKRANLFLRLLANKTSGRFQYTDSAKHLARSFEQIAAQLRQQYTLGYYPKNRSTDGNERQIKVGVAVPRATVQTRKSYVYKPAKGAGEKQ